MADASKFKIVIKPDAADELSAIRTFDRRRIVDDIDSELGLDADVETKRKKLLDGVIAGFLFEPPLWELKIGDYRVYYDVKRIELMVYIRAVRFKGTRTTAEVLR